MSFVEHGGGGVDGLRAAHRLARDRIGAAVDRAARRGVPITVVAIPRHGFATTALAIERFYEATQTDVAFIYVDVASPPAVARYLEQEAGRRKDFHVLRIEQPISRQMARLLVLDLVSTPFVLFLDNNMLLAPKCVDALLACAGEYDAEVVSPVIVMQGGNMHFSGAHIERRADGTLVRHQTTARSPLTAPLDACEIERGEIDFAESHCCLMRTRLFKDRIDALFPAALHNAHTIAFACETARRAAPATRMLIEPDALASILPIAFGYDVPWLFDSYNNWSYFRESYALHSKLLDTPSTTLGNLRWHRRHLMYLLYSAVAGGFVERQDMLSGAEIPEYVDGYDRPLPAGVEAIIEREFMPFVANHYGRHAGTMHTWLYRIEEAIAGIDHLAAGGGGEGLVPRRIRGRLWTDDSGDACLIVNEGDRDGVRLSDSAAAVWRCCNGVNSQAKIAGGLVQAYPEFARQVVEGVDEALRRFEELGVVEMQPPAGGPIPRGPEELDVVVINRECDVERRRRAQSQLDREEIAFRVFPAVDKENLGNADFDRYVTDEGRRLFSQHGRIPVRGSLNNGSLAVALSWRAIVEALYPGARPLLVLEDDFVLCEKFGRRLRSLLPLLPDDWHLAYLSWNPHTWENSRPLNPWVEKIFERIHGTGGLLVNPSVRDVMLRLFPLTRQIDHDLPDRLITPGIVNAYKLTNRGEPLVRNDNFGGSLTQR